MQQAPAPVILGPGAQPVIVVPHLKIPPAFVVAQSAAVEAVMIVEE